jgi:hypothetical protein
MIRANSLLWKELKTPDESEGEEITNENSSARELLPDAPPKDDKSYGVGETIEFEL